MKNKASSFKSGNSPAAVKSFFLSNLFLSCAGSSLFALSHSNYFFLKGLPPLAFIALIPFFLLIKRSSLRFSFLWGAFSGALSYLCFNFWIIFFHPLAVYILLFQYAVLYALLFFMLKVMDLAFPKYGFFFQTIAWVAYEYVKTCGFTGYAYGIMGYTQWPVQVLVRSASLFGVWGLSFLTVSLSAILAHIIFEVFFQTEKKRIKAVFLSYRFSFFVWLFIFAGFILYGIFLYEDYQDFPKAKIALIQPDKDPWIGNIEVYKRDFEELQRLSKEAIRKNRGLDLIVWPETAFIPRIKWHYKYASDSASFLLVRTLLQFIDGQKTPFLIGNDDAVLVNDKQPPSEDNRKDYNAAMLFIPKQNVLPPEPVTYRKMRLVPFTEYFPYKKAFPFIYDFLERHDTHFWERGKDPSVFSLRGMQFGTPICFEDTFGYISADFVRNGANMIINLTNDSWAKSRTAQYQHLGMAVLRAAENRVPVLRSAISGQTAYIDPNGTVQAMLEPFVSGNLIVQVPILTKHRKTVYTRLGDYLAVSALGIIFVISIIIFTKKIKEIIFRRSLLFFTRGKAETAETGEL